MNSGLTSDSMSGVTGCLMTSSPPLIMLIVICRPIGGSRVLQASHVREQHSLHCTPQCAHTEGGGATLFQPLANEKS